MKKTLAFLTALLCLLFTGCGGNQPPTEPSTAPATEASTRPETTGASEETTLWVVCEYEVPEDEDSRIPLAVKQFQENHENVRIELERLPQDGEERADRLEEIRSEIRAGGGPDAYLLSSQAYFYQPLFDDVTLAMGNGVFRDISAFYDADAALNTQALNGKIMDAGTLDGARYVLPLWFNCPMYYVDMGEWEKTSLTPDMFDAGILRVMDELIALGDERWACGGEIKDVNYGLDMFPGLPDYAAGSVTVDPEQLVTYMTRYQALRELIGSMTDHRIRLDSYVYMEYGDFWGENGFPMYCDNLSGCIGALRSGVGEGRTIGMYPVRGIDGKLTADVTFWAAVGSGSACPELAYDFIRTFLLEEYQWGTNLEENDTFTTFMAMFYRWPVRTEGAVQALLDVDTRMNKCFVDSGNSVGWRDRKQTLLNADLSRISIRPVWEEIDRVKFSIREGYDFQTLLQELNGENGTKNADVSMEALAEKVIRMLEQHLKEG